MGLSNKRYLKRVLILIALFLVVCLPLLYFGGSYYLRDRKIVRAHAQIQVGDSKQTVIALMGQPSLIEKCNDGDMWGLTPEQRTFKEQCTDTYVYTGFLRRDDVVFDKNDSVLAKYVSVSP
jgi:hypothetical protein